MLESRARERALRVVVGVIFITHIPKPFTSRAYTILLSPIELRMDIYPFCRFHPFAFVGSYAYNVVYPVPS